ncbi:MAG: exosortase H-associated membrane protein [Rudaea sp.]|uniref:exosortase H-associated membrane protein n=1 Tax=Rudaea sp. TaxID=2136325 RepID=UPI0039E3CF88
MDAHVPQRARVDALMRDSPIYRFLLIGALWLPAAFFLWFSLRAQFAWPVVQIAKATLLHFWPHLFLDVVAGADEINQATGQLLAHHGDWMQVDTNVLYNAVKDGAPKFAFFDFALNPMIYGYSVPLFAGLVMATPLETWRRAVQIVTGLVVLWLTQSFGVVAEAFKVLGLQLPEGTAKMHELGYSTELIALAYQFGYLILPPLVPAVLWILFNRAFIEELTRPSAAAAAEPNRANAVEAPQPGE